MDVTTIVQSLRQERSRLDEAISALETLYPEASDATNHGIHAVQHNRKKWSAEHRRKFMVAMARRKKLKKAS